MRRWLALWFLSGCAAPAAPAPREGVAELVAIDTGGWDTGFTVAPLPGPHVLASPGAVPAILQSDAMCWLLVLDTFDRLRVDVVDLDAARTGVLTAQTVRGGYFPSSITLWNGELVLSGRAAGQRQIARLDPATGAVLGRRRVGATDVHASGGFLFDGGRQPGWLDRYRSVGDVLAGRRVTRSVRPLVVWGSGEPLLPAARSGATDSVELFNPATLVQAAAVRLDGFDTVVMAVQADARHLYVLDTGNARYQLTPGGQILGLYDPTTGANQRNVEIAGSAIVDVSCVDHSP
ncbi:MAG TPA: hypothetical protein PKA64_24905 [Myxococcota bacterium]|nr:hypothetical protein [Myxococcota bacterium]